MNSCGLQGGHLFRSRAVASGDDCPGMAHAPSWRGGLSGDETDDGLVHVRLGKCGGLLFRVSADFPDHHHRLRVRVILKETEAINEVGAVDGIAADADAGGLPQSGTGELADLLTAA